MIDSFLNILGASHNYELIAIMISGVVSCFILIQFLSIFTYLIKKVGGF